MKSIWFDCTVGIKQKTLAVKGFQGICSPNKQIINQLRLLTSNLGKLSSGLYTL